MSEPVKRLNSRRPFYLTAEGLKRIVLGEVAGAGGTVTLRATGHAARAPKPRRLQGTATSHILAVAHSDRGALDGPAQEAIAAASLLSDAATAVVVLVLGDLAQDIASLGADLIVTMPQGGDSRFNPTLELAVLTAVIARYQPRHILLADNETGGGDLGRRLAAELDAEIATHVVELQRDTVAVYRRGGAVMARRDLPKIILLDPETTDIVLPYVGIGERVNFDLPVTPDGPYLDLGLMAVEASSLALEEADFVVSAGNGVSDVPMLEALAAMFGAAVGASRVAVDDGKFPRAKQVGATGKTVSASVYMAVGISGAVQHLQGIRGCRHVIAINRDAAAPIAKRADLTIVDDAQAVMTALIDARRGRNRAGDAPPASGGRA
jgi:electron transfer flavoprotein alpha subunit